MCKGYTSIITGITTAFFCVVVGCTTSPRYTRGNQSVRPSFHQSHKKGVKLSQKQSSKKIRMSGKASYYGRKFHGKKTASGERFDMYDLTAAHKKFPFNTMVKVINLDNKKSVIVRINDRGPYKKGRIIDLSYAAAKKIGLIQTGTARVKLKIVN